ncbi:hypothetical protein [Paenibacillus jiagnxiensis]|uniref:hypothetical protein n=1 Tax=Paenibacillus jiagnxiensis TaxID=3228926 RepID=UPI0033B8E2A1
MKGHNGHKEYVEQLNKIQSMMECMMMNMDKNENGTNHGRTEEIASKRIDFTIENELRLQRIYKQLNQLKEEVKVFVHQVDHPGKIRKKPGPEPGGIKRHYTLTMPQEDWDIIDHLIKGGRFRYVADYFRFLHRSFTQSPASSKRGYQSRP